MVLKLRSLVKLVTAASSTTNLRSYIWVKIVSPIPQPTLQRAVTQLTIEYHLPPCMCLPFCISEHISAPTICNPAFALHLCCPGGGAGHCQQDGQQQQAMQRTQDDQGQVQPVGRGQQRGRGADAWERGAKGRKGGEDKGDKGGEEGSKSTLASRTSSNAAPSHKAFATTISTLLCTSPSPYVFTSSPWREIPTNYSERATL